MNIESKLWKLVSYTSGTVTVIQKASGQSRVVSRGKLPNAHALANMNEKRFDAFARAAFHNEEPPR